MEYTSDSVPDPDNTPIKPIYDDEMDQLLVLFHLENYDNLLDFDLQMIQTWLEVDPYSEFYTISTVFFHKYRGNNVGVTNCMSYFYIFVTTQDNVKLANDNMGHVQGIGITLNNFQNCPIINPMGPVYQCPGHPSNTISLGSLRCYVAFQKVLYKPLRNCYFVDP